MLRIGQTVKIHPLDQEFSHYINRIFHYLPEDDRNRFVRLGTEHYGSFLVHTTGNMTLDGIAYVELKFSRGAAPFPVPEHFIPGIISYPWIVPGVLARITATLDGLREIELVHADRVSEPYVSM